MLRYLWFRLVDCQISLCCHWMGPPGRPRFVQFVRVRKTSSNEFSTSVRISPARNNTTLDSRKGLPTCAFLCDETRPLRWSALEILTLQVLRGGIHAMAINSGSLLQHRICESNYRHSLFYCRQHFKNDSLWTFLFFHGLPSNYTQVFNSRSTYAPTWSAWSFANLKHAYVLTSGERRLGSYDM